MVEPRVTLDIRSSDRPHDTLLAEVAARTGAHALQADVSVEATTPGLSRMSPAMGGIDVLVNNAGYVSRAEIGALDIAAMRRMFETNVFGLVESRTGSCR